MKTLGVLLLLVACVAAGSWHKSSNEHKSKDPAIERLWLSHNKKTSYFKLDDDTWIEYFTSEKGHFNRYKTLSETKSGCTILKPLNEKENFFLAICKTKVLYQEKTFKNIEKHGDVESEGNFIKLEKSKHSKSKSKSKHSKSKSKSKHSKSKSKSKHSKSNSKSNHSWKSKHSKKCKACVVDPCKNNKCETNKILTCKRECLDTNGRDVCNFAFTFKNKAVKCPAEDNNEQVRWIGLFNGSPAEYQKTSSTTWIRSPGNVQFHRVSSTTDTDGYITLTLKRDGVANVVVLSQGSSKNGTNTVSTLTDVGRGYWADSNKNFIPRPKEDSHAQVKWVSKDKTGSRVYIQIDSDKWIRFDDNVFNSEHTQISTKTNNGYREVVLQQDGTSNFVKLTQGKLFTGSSQTSVTTESDKTGYWENKYGNPVTSPKESSKNLVKWIAADNIIEFVKISSKDWLRYDNGSFFAAYKRIKSSTDKNGYPVLELKEEDNEEYVRLTEGEAFRSSNSKSIRSDLADGFWADKTNSYVLHPPSGSVTKSHSRSKSKSKKSKSHSKSKSKSKKSKKSKKCSKCKKDPCGKKKKCKGYPDAECVRDCKKCKATWYYHDDKVSCEKDSHSSESKSDSNGSHH